MAWAFVQARRQALHTGVSFSGNTVAGNRAILGIVVFNNTASPVISGVSDAKNGAWHQDFLTTDATSKMTYGCFSVNIGTQLLSSDTITVSYSSNTPIDANSSLSLLEYSGLSTAANAVDVIAGPNATHSGSTSVTSGNSSATTGANELALILYGDDDADTISEWATAPTASAARVNTVTGAGDAVCQWIGEKDSGSSGSVIAASGTQSGDEDWCIGVVVFKLAGGAASTFPPEPNGLPDPGGQQTNPMLRW